MDSQTRMQKAYDFLLEELKTIRTGRANAALVEDVVVEHYGTEMPLKQLANISTPDAKSLTISPWDPSALASIEKAIRDNPKLDLNPLNDGKALHINVPPLTQERREVLVKQVNEKVEQAHIALRNIRHEILGTAKRQQTAKEISEDEYHRLDKQLTSQMEDYRAKIEQAANDKHKEISTV